MAAHTLWKTFTVRVVVLFEKKAIRIVKNCSKDHKNLPTQVPSKVLGKWVCIEGEQTCIPASSANIFSQKGRSGNSKKLPKKHSTKECSMSYFEVWQKHSKNLALKKHVEKTIEAHDCLCQNLTTADKGAPYISTVKTLQTIPRWLTAVSQSSAISLT